MVGVWRARRRVGHVALLRRRASTVITDRLKKSQRGFGAGVNFRPEACLNVNRTC